MQATDPRAIKVIIPGPPVAQGRPRATKIGKSVRVYDPKPSRDYKAYVKLIAKQHAPANLLEGALGVNLKIYRQIPKSMTKKAHKEAEAGILRPVTKPDADNYCKSVLDALNGIIYKDDSQIVDVQTEKYYSDNPRAEIEVTEVF